MSNETPPAGGFLIGPLGTIEDVDDAGCALLGYRKDELVGLHGSESIPPERRPGVAVTLDRMRQVTARRLPEGRLMLSLHPTDMVS
jgi:PAS domain S-box-containing protein